MSDVASDAVNAVHNGVRPEFPVEDYGKVRCALLVYADQMKIRKMVGLMQKALYEVARLDKLCEYDAEISLQRGMK